MAKQAEAAGMSSERLSRIDAFLDERYLEPGRLPGTLLLVHRRGALAHLSVKGMADVERKRPLQEDTIFRIYSMTKPIASVALLMLLEEGKVQLDEPVHRHIPEFRDLGVFVSGGAGAPFRRTPAKRAMQIVDLLRHTSGLTYGIQQRTNVDAAYRESGIGVLPRGKFTLDDMMKEVARLPLDYSPGDHWTYSLATDVVGYLVEKISGVPFEQFLRERIFVPLQMSDTNFLVPPAKVDRFAALYTVGRNAGLALMDDPATSGYLEPPAFHSGGGGLVSTAGDYLKFCRMMLAGGAERGARLLSPKTVALMTANHLPGGRLISDIGLGLFADSYPGCGFGLGYAVTVDPALSLMPGSAGEYFWGGWASTYFFIDPKEELIVIFMTQLGPSTFYPIRRELKALVYAAIVE